MTPTPEPVHWFRITRPNRADEMLKVVGNVRVHNDNGCVSVVREEFGWKIVFHECGVGITDVTDPNKASIETERPTPKPAEKRAPLEKP
ncbi:MAG: hypothetical protein AAB608_01495 [Patescibacteria group bacterium]